MPLSQCNRWALLQLDSRRCRLTKENITESELTLQRAGYFGKTAQQGEKMFVCPIHRANLGKDWGNPIGRTECRYPDHKGKHTCAETWQSVEVRLQKLLPTEKLPTNLLVVSANSRLADGRLHKFRGGGTRFSKKVKSYVPHRTIWCWYTNRQETWSFWGRNGHENDQKHW